MPAAGRVAFGPYKLDLASKRLLRAGEPVVLADRHLDLLCALVNRAGALVSKDDLMRAAWGDRFVSDNSLAQLVSQVRAELDSGSPERYITTARGRGYRFVEPVTPADARSSDDDIDTLLAVHRAVLDSRAALETLQLDRVARARSTYEALLAQRGDDPRVHVGLANACLEQFEATRADVQPDVELLQRAEFHAREGVRLNLNYADAWATLGPPPFGGDLAHSIPSQRPFRHRRS